MAEERSHKIILIKEKIDEKKVDVEGFIASSMPAADTIDAVSVMMTKFEPDESTYQANYEAGFVAKDLTDSEVEEWKKKPEVDEVFDDIEVFALEQPPGSMEDDDAFDEDLAMGELELDPEDTEALKEELEWDPEEEPSTEMLRLLAELEPGVEEADIELEHRLLEATAEASAEQLRLPSIPREQLIKLIKCILKCVFAQKGSAEEVTTEDIEAALRSAGVEGGAPAAAAADVILWNLRLIYAPQAWRYSTGNGVRVAVVDTGIEPGHPDLRVYGGVSYVPKVTSWADGQHHGTHVAGIIAAVSNGRGIVGVAPRARLYAVKVLRPVSGGRARGRLSWILNGLMWCHRARMHIVNLSLGSPVGTHDPRVYSRLYERVGRTLRGRGILCVAAAGNLGLRPVYNPARCPSYMAVSAIDRRRRLARFSCVGPQVEICAPGVQILSTVPRRGYRRLSGTSMACPHVAGVAALVKARRPTWHGDRIRVHMWRTAIDLGAAGRDRAYGFGQVNAYRAVR